MHVALLTDGLHPFVLGGMQRHSIQLARSLAQADIELTVVHPDPGGASNRALALFDAAHSARVDVRAVPFPRHRRYPGHYLVESLEFSRRIVAALGDLRRYDVVYAKGFTGWSLLRDRSSHERPPVAVNFHGYEMFQPAPSLRASIEQRMLRGPVRRIAGTADGVISYGGAITDIISEHVGVARDRIYEIPAGIECGPEPRRAMRPPGNRRYLFVGRYERRKGIEELFEAINRIDASPGAEFRFVGNIPKGLRRSRPDFIYDGEIKDSETLRSVRQWADILVCPSVSEGMPNVILEALDAGLAVIATAVGAVPALVDEECGWLVEPRNVGALSRALISSLEIDPASLLAKQLAGRARVRERHDWSMVGRLTTESLRLIAARRR